MSARARRLCAALCALWVLVALVRLAAWAAGHPGGRTSLYLILVAGGIGLVGLWVFGRSRSAGPGCVCCGADREDVRTFPATRAPRGEGYCWPCVDKLGMVPAEYTVQPGRERS